MHELRHKPDRARCPAGICELAQEEADRGGTHLAAGLGHGSETGSEEVGPLEVVEGDQGHLVRNGELRFTKRPHGPDRHVVVFDHERRWRAGQPQQSSHGSTSRLSHGIAGRRQFGYELQSTVAQSKLVAAQPLSRGRHSLETGHDRDSAVTQIGEMRNQQRR